MELEDVSVRSGDCPGIMELTAEVIEPATRLMAPPRRALVLLGAFFADLPAVLRAGLRKLHLQGCLSRTAGR